MSTEEVASLLVQLCSGLQAAHDRGIVHRDLKPTNIFLDQPPGNPGGDARLKILDFGIAKIKDRASSTQRGEILGSAEVIAPEQVEGDGHRITPLTDIYALGVIMFWMLAGRPPFSKDTFAGMIYCHLHTPPPDLQQVAPTVPPAVARLVMQCLAKVPAQRPASVSEVSRALLAALAGPDKQGPAPQRPAPQRRSLLLIGILGLSLLGGALLLGSARLLFWPDPAGPTGPGGRSRAASSGSDVAGAPAQGAANRLDAARDGSVGARDLHAGSAADRSSRPPDQRRKRTPAMPPRPRETRHRPEKTHGVQRSRRRPPPPARPAKPVHPEDWIIE